jgi:D-alanyl-D-alanine carboxypeptidase (penicillin-binding protein 5/6)
MTSPLRAIAAALVTGALGVTGLVGVPAAASTSTDDPLDARGVVVDGRMPPKILARSWIVVDADSGDVLAAKNAHERLRPASTLKTLTAITLLPKLDLDDTYRVRWEDAHTTGSAVGIVPGSRYTIDELFYGLMLPSGNDAARALASAAGGLRHTVRAMNRQAAALGAVDTRATNPTGLDAPGQLSSAFDLAIFARAGLTHRDFRRYVSTVSIPFPAQEPKRDRPRDTYMIYNQNPLLLDGYRGTLGVKTGYTTQAGRTFVAAVERSGQTLIVALMGIVEPSDAAAKRLLTWGFAHGTGAAPVGSLDRSEPVAEQAPPGGLTATTPLPQAAGVDAGAIGSESSPGVGMVLLGLAGVGLAIGGWWLQRRRA